MLKNSKEIESLWGGENLYKKSLGLIETIGLVAAVEAADAALKAANVELIGYELTKGSGMVTVKIQGNVSSVNVAVDAAKQAVNKIGKIYSIKVIPKKADGLEKIIYSRETIGYRYENKFDKETFTDDKLNINYPLNETIKDNNSEDVKCDNNQLVAEDNEDKLTDSENSQLCNLCSDPKCIRKKGDLKNKCIHYKDIKKEE